MSSTALPPPLPPRRPSSISTSTTSHLSPPVRTSSSSGPAQLHSSLPNGSLHSLLRRFNTQATHLRLAPVAAAERLDFCPSKEEQWSPDKLRSNVERLYLTVGRDCRQFGKQISLLRSWEQPLRTGTWASVYFLAWSSPLGIIAFLFLILSLLILYPSVRVLLFPPLPPPLPALLASQSPTTDPQKTQTELEELDASIWAEEVAQLGAAATGAEVPKGGFGGPEASVQGMVHETVVGTKEEEEASKQEEEKERAEAEAEEDEDSDKKDKKKKEDPLALHGLPVQKITGDLADGWERWANAFAPTSPPFDPDSARRKVALNVLPCILAFGLLPSWFINKALGALVGLAFFGGPGIERGVRWLNERYPGWQEAIELRHTMLAGVPSNTQLTVTLLRNAEVAGQPLPPPPAPLPVSAPPPKIASASNTHAADHADTDSDDEDDDSASHSSHSHSTKKSGKQKFSSFIKSATSLTEQGAGYVSGQKKVNWHKLGQQATDKLAPGAGKKLAEKAMKHLPKGVTEEEQDEKSHSTFYCNHKSTLGHLLLEPPIRPTHLTYRPIGVAPSVPLSIPLDSLTLLRKTAGLGWKGRMALNWTTGVGSVGEGIKISWREREENGEDREREESFGGCVRRDELWNRIVGSMGGKWELL